MCNKAWMHQVLETSWALFKAGSKGAASDGSDTTVPLGDKCEECFGNWKKAFDHYEWEALVSAFHDSKTSVKQEWEQSLLTAATPAKRTWPASGVTSGKQCVAEVSKSFVVLSERELLKEANCKLSRAVLRSIPSIKFHDDKGAEEELYLFQNDAQPHKVLTIKQLQVHDTHCENLAVANHMFENQADQVWQHTMKLNANTSGLAHALCPQTGIPSLHSFVVAQQGAGQQGAGEGEVAAEQQVDSDSELMGVAALSMKPPPLQTPSSTKPKRSSSSGTLTERLFPVAPKHLEFAAADDDDDADDDKGSIAMSLDTCAGGSTEDKANIIAHTLIPFRLELQMNESFLCHGRTLENVQIAGEYILGLPVAWTRRGDVNKWKVKVPLLAVLEGKVDGRTITGLKRRVDKLTEQNKHSQAGLLRNYSKLVQLADGLAAASLVGMEEATFTAALMAMEQEGIILPVSVKSNIVARECDRAVTSRRYDLLLDLINPFKRAEWVVHSPCLAAIGCPEPEKLETFESVFIDNALQPIIRKGSAGKQEMLEFLAVACDLFLKIDPLDLEDKSAGVLADVRLVCSALSAILAADVNPDAEALCQNMIFWLSPPTHFKAHTWNSHLYLL
eukprot:1140805-Amphidinium_carterae.2